jgi:hypothetical protein
MQIHFFATEPTRAEQILANCLPDCREWQPYSSGERVPLLFLFSPLWCNEHYVSADISWKQYFARHQPETKLISIGVQAADHSNYLDLLQPPENFAIFLENARTCAEEWLPADTGGLDMNQKLKRFFEGHGNESVGEAFSILLRRFRIVNKELEDGTPYAEIHQDLLLPTQTPASWQKLVNRWQAYYLFFSCLPFWPLFQDIDRLMAEVQPFFDRECRSPELLQKLQIIDKIETINLRLKEAEQYVWNEPPNTDR